MSILKTYDKGICTGMVGNDTPARIFCSQCGELIGSSVFEPEGPSLCNKCKGKNEKMDLQELEAIIEYLKELNVSKGSGLYQVIIDQEGIKLHLNPHDFLWMFPKYKRTFIESSIFNEAHVMFNDCKIFTLLKKENCEIVTEAIKKSELVQPEPKADIPANPKNCQNCGYLSRDYTKPAYCKTSSFSILAESYESCRGRFWKEVTK